MFLNIVFENRPQGPSAWYKICYTRILKNAYHAIMASVLYLISRSSTKPRLAWCTYNYNTNLGYESLQIRSVIFNCKKMLFISFNFLLNVLPFCHQRPNVLPLHSQATRYFSLKRFKMNYHSNNVIHTLHTKVDCMGEYNTNLAKLFWNPL